MIKVLKVYLFFGFILLVSQFLVGFILGLVFGESNYSLYLSYLIVSLISVFLGFKAASILKNEKNITKHFGSSFFLGSYVGIVSMLLFVVINFLLTSDFQINSVLLLLLMGTSGIGGIFASKS